MNRNRRWRKSGEGDFDEASIDQWPDLPKRGDGNSKAMGRRFVDDSRAIGAKAPGYLDRLDLAVNREWPDIRANPRRANDALML